MRKRRIYEYLPAAGEGGPTADEGGPAASMEGNGSSPSASGGRQQQLAAGADKNGGEAPAEPAKAYAKPRSHRELGEAIFDEANPVKVGAELLDKDNDDRGAPNRLRSLQTFADWAYGERNAEGSRKPPRIIWDIPGPPYEPVDPEAEESEGGEK